MGGDSSGRYKTVASGTMTSLPSMPKGGVSMLPQGTENLTQLLANQKKRLGQKNARAGLLAAVGAPKFKLRARSPAMRNPQLLRCVGSAQLMVQRSAASLTHTDVFILDDTKHVYVFVGRDSSRITKSKAIEIATNIKDREYQGRVNVVLVDYEDKAAPAREFWDSLGGAPESVSSDSSLDGSAVWAATEMHTYHEDKWACTASGNLHKEALLSDHTRCVVVTCVDEVYVWNGKLSTEETRQLAEAHAKSLLATKAEWATLEYVVDGGEKAVFKAKFADFSHGMDISVKAAGNIKYEKTFFQTGSDVVDKKDAVSANQMLANPCTPPPPVDDGKGAVCMWHCTEKTHTELEPSEFGQFYSKDSYVILYERSDKVDIFITYFWHGADARPNEKGAAVLLAVELDSDHSSTQVRVNEGEEMEHFYSIIAHTPQTHMCVRSGTRPVSVGQNCEERGRVEVYQVSKRGQYCRADQQEERSILACRAYVVLEQSTNATCTAFIWRGKAGQPIVLAAADAWHNNSNRPHKL